MTAQDSIDRITVTGPDAEKFLHSLLSQDVTGIAPGEVRMSFLLQPQGKLVGYFAIARNAATAGEGDEFVLDLAPGNGAGVHAALTRYLIRTKAVLRLEEGVARPSDSEYDRIRDGLPAWGRELTESTIPNETGLTDRAVSFTKGCYVGQELVERIDSRGGNVPKRLCRLDLAGMVVPADGVADLFDGDRAVGAVTSAAADPSGRRVRALGYVRREIADGGRVRVEWEGGSDTATVCALNLATGSQEVSGEKAAGQPRTGPPA